ncbi:MAG: NFACT family protein [Defluviitaleaceae bacterium]|nr:NFACT family protein [Defluviitaleaceae bacterium]
MPFDGTVLASVIHELCFLKGGRIDKITQPERDEIILHIRAKGENHRLLLTSNPTAPRLGLITENKNSPLQAPMFCMLLRKHIGGGRIVAVEQPRFERIVELHIDAVDELGERSGKALVLEIMGKHSNIILLDTDKKILGAIKHVPPSISTARPILPNMRYSPPPSQGKINPLADKLKIQNSQTTIQKNIFKSYTGISPLLATEICERAGVYERSVLSDSEKIKLQDIFAEIFSCVKNNQFENAIYSENGKPIDITALPFSIYSRYEKQIFGSPSEMLEMFYSQHDEAYRISQKTADLRKIVTNLQNRCYKKGVIFQKTLEEIQERDQLRIKGELLTSYIYKLERGMTSFTAENFYDNNQLLEIALEPTLTPAENAQKYFKKYNKQKRTFEALQEQVKENNHTLFYLESVAASLLTTATEADIAQVQQELIEQGFVKARSAKGKKNQRPAKPLKIRTADGFDIYVGKNNTQNDEITFKIAKPHDLWFHIKNMPGPHVVLVTNGVEPSENAILEAAALAVKHSRASGSTKMEVAYTAKKHIKKPPNAKPGLVTYDRHRTVIV